MSQTPVIIEAEIVSPTLEAERDNSQKATPPKAKSPFVPALLAGALAGGFVSAPIAYFMRSPEMMTTETIVSPINVSALEKRLSELETNRVQTAPTETAQPLSASGTVTPSGDMALLEKRLTQLEAIPHASQNEIETLKNDLSTLKSKPIDFSPLITRLKALETRPEGTDVSSLKYVAMMGLLASVEAGRPFILELKTLSKIDPTNTVLKSLEPFAATGVKTSKELLEQTPALYVLFEKNAKLNEDASMMDKAKNMLFSLVRVRPLNEQIGQSPAAILSRIEARLKGNDILAAFGEWSSLEETLKKVSTSFGQNLQQASEAKGAVAKLSRDMQKSLETLR